MMLSDRVDIGPHYQILHVASGLGRLHGGPSYSIPRLCQAQRQLGLEVDLFSIDLKGNDPLDLFEPRLFNHDWSRWPVISDMRFSGGMAKALSFASARGTIIHSHGLWLMPNVMAGQAARKAGLSLIVSPRGMVSDQALRYSRVRKQLFWELFQKAAYSEASVWHATSEAEADEIRAFGVRCPIAIIPNGIEFPVHTGKQATTKRLEIISLGRIHPKKGLDNLLSGWAILAPDFPNWSLRIIGPSEDGYADVLKRRSAELCLPRVSIEAPVFGFEKWQAMQRASLFVLPTLNENFGIAVGEALIAGTPAIVSKGAPWASLSAEGCGWWVDHGVAPLVHAMRAALELPPSELAAMGTRGKSWVEREFTWNAIASEFSNVYRWLATRGSPPSCFRMR